MYAFVMAPVLCGHSNVNQFNLINYLTKFTSNEPLMSPQEKTNLSTPKYRQTYLFEILKQMSYLQRIHGYLLVF